MKVNYRSRIEREAGSKTGPITQEELDFLGEELQDMYRGIRKYETAYDLKTPRGEKADGRVNFDNENYELILDAELVKDDALKIETYVHELMHVLRNVIDDSEEWLVDEQLTPKALIALMTHYDENVRELAYKGFRAWEARYKRLHNISYNEPVDETEKESSEYILEPELAVAYQRSPILGGMDPEVARWKVYELLSQKGSYDNFDKNELKLALGYKDWEIAETERLYNETVQRRKENETKAIRNRFQEQINAINGAEDNTQGTREAAIDMGVAVGGAAEKLGRRIIKTPLSIFDKFLGNYSGDVINLNTEDLVDENPNITNMISKGLKSRGTKAFEKQRARRRSAIEAQRDDEIHAVDQRYGRIEHIYQNSLRSLRAERTQIARELARK